MQPNSYRAFLRNYYLLSFFYDCIFAYAIYTVLFSIRGLSVFQISLLIAWWALTSMLLEIPTGALSDYWSRRSLLLIAPLIKMLCFISWFFADGNFYIFALGFLFWSLGSTLVSGTTEAILYDTLSHFGKTNEYEKILGRKRFYVYIALAISMISGGIIAEYDLNLPIILSILPLLLSSFFASLIKDVPKVQAKEKHRYIEYVKIALREVRTNRILLYLLIYILGISILGDLVQFDQLYFQLVSLPLSAFGFVGFIWSLMAAIGSYFAFRFKGKALVLYFFPFVAALFLALVALFPSIPMIILLLLTYLIIAPLAVLTESKIQHNITSISRGTVTSIVSLFNCLFGLLVILMFGIVSRIWNLQAIYLSTSIFLFVFSIWTYLARKGIAIKTQDI